jgi:hypothetical protein
MTSRKPTSGVRSRRIKWEKRNGPITTVQLDRCDGCGRFHREECATWNR